MWTAPDGKRFLRFEQRGRLRSYVRPVGAALMSAGLDEVRRPRSLIIAASLTLVTSDGVSLAFGGDHCRSSRLVALAKLLKSENPLRLLFLCFGEDLVAEDLAGGHDRPAGSRQLVGERHCDQALRLSGSQRG